MNYKHYFEKAMKVEEFETLLGEHAELFKLHYEKFQVSPGTQEILMKTSPLKVLALTEPWCGDSLAIYPVIKKIVENTRSWELRVLLRDENLDLMDQFLTRGGRAVPIFLFLTGDYSLLFKWGPRPKAAQDIYEEYRERIESGQIEKKDIIKKIRYFYSSNAGQSILSEIMEKIG